MPVNLKGKYIVGQIWPISDYNWLIYELSLCASGLADRLGDLEFPARLGDLESPVLLGDLEFRSDRLGDRELRATGDRLGDREPRPTGDLDLFEAGDASLAFRAGDRSLDL